jgi:hypothetical protein
MEIRVECYAGYRGEQEPRAFWLGERRVAVVEILDRWLAPDHRYFRIKGDDGHVYVLRSDDAKNQWSLGAFTHVRAAATSAAHGPHSPPARDPK